MMVTAFLTITLYFFILIWKSKQQRLIDTLLFNLFSGLSLMTFYGSIFFIATMIFIARKRTYLFIGFCIALLLLSPLLIQQIKTAEIGLQSIQNWSMVLGKVELKNILLIPLKFTIGRISWFPKWTYYGVGILSVIGIFLSVYFGARKNKMLLFFLIGPVLLGLLVSFITPMMQYFRFLYLIPIMCLLIGIGVKKNRFLTYIPIIIFLFFSLLYIFFPQFHREDWKALTQELNSQFPVFMILPSSDPVWYYNPRIPLSELRSIEGRRLTGVITIIPYVEEVYGFTHETILEKKGCIRIKEIRYRGLIREDWNCSMLASK